MKHYIHLLFALLYSSYLIAQAPFLGGVGSGAAQANLAGVDTCVYVYAGQIGSGAVSTSLTGVDTCVYVYAGQVGSGSTNALYANPFSCSMFFGDTLSGYYTNIVPSTQNCFSYNGDIGSGHNKNIYTNLAPCPAFYASVSGSDGYDSRSYTDDNGVCYVFFLPIESSPLFAKIENKKGYLYWTTYTELNNLGFEIQKSFDGINWQKIGWLNGADTHIGSLNYEFWDESLQYGNQYYRFIQIDYDNSLSISNTVNLNLQQNTTVVEPLNHIAIYPNPVQLGRTLSIRSWISYELKAQLFLYNSLGQLIRQAQYTFDEYNSLFEITTQELSSGNYFLVIINENDKKILSTQKIIVVP